MTSRAAAIGIGILTLLALGLLAGAMKMAGGSPPIWIGLFVGVALGGLNLLFESLSLTWALKKEPSAMLFVSLESNPTPFFGGQLVPLPILSSFLLVTDSSGGINLAYLWPGGLPSGTELYVQYALDDVFAPFGVALSNALRGTVP